MTARGTVRLVWMSILMAFLTACGSGGGVTAVDPPPDSTATRADVTIRTQAASAETVLFGVELLLNLPFGVTVAALPDGSVASSALETTVLFAGARYIPPTATDPARILIQAADPNGFTVGNLVTVHCSIASGARVTPASFTVTDFVAKNQNDIEITGVSPRLSVQIQ